MTNEIREQLVAVLSNTLVPAFPPGKIVSLIPSPSGNSTDTNYPKMALVLDGGNLTPVASRQQERSFNFVAALVLKKTAAVPDVQVALNNWIAALDKELLANYTLGGKVSSADLTEFELDAGAWYPEGCAVAVISVSTVVCR